MNSGLHVKNGIVIPNHELQITASRSGGAGGQHVNKTDTKITVRWNVEKTGALTDTQKKRVIKNLKSRLTKENELIVHNSQTRSQQQNKEKALFLLAHEVRKALHVAKKRIKTVVPKSVKEARLREKSHRSTVKKMRSKKIDD